MKPLVLLPLLFTTPLVSQEVLPDPEKILEDVGSKEVLEPPAPNSTPSKVASLAPEQLRDQLTRRLGSLREEPSEKTQHLPLPLWISEQERGAVTGFRDVEYRYRIEKQRIPRYKYEYEEYEQYVQVPASNDPYETRMVYKKIKSQRITSHRVVGYDTRDVKVYDPNGPHKETRQVAEYENASSAAVHAGWFGTNAMTFLGMLKCGLPADDTRLQAGLDSLTSALIAYGAPDRTWDLAWVTALFVNLPQDNKLYHDWTNKLVGKLIAGANLEGETAGFWGPVCVNPGYLAAIIQFDQRYKERYLTPLDTEIARETRERSKERLIKKKNEIIDIYQKWAFIYKIWGVCGLNPYATQQSHVYPAEVDRQPNIVHSASARAAGLPCEFTRLQLGDIECTSLALFALKEAAEQKLLPERTPVPYDLKLNALAVPVSTREVLTKSLAALLDARTRDGRWNSCTTSHGHNAFNRIDLNEALIPVSDCRKLPAREHPAYQVLAVAALHYLASTLEGADAGKAQAAADQSLGSLWPEITTLSKDLVVEDLPGRETTLWHLAELCQSGTRAGRKAWETLATILLERAPQGTSLRASSWSRIPANWRFQNLPGFLEVSSEELLIRRERLLAKLKDGDPDPVSIDATSSMEYAQTPIFCAPRPVAETTTLAFLASGIRPPAFAFWQHADTDPRPAALRLLGDVYSRKKVRVSTIAVGPDLPHEEIINSPFVVLEQHADGFHPGEAPSDSLKTYLSENNGTLLVLCDDDAEGTKFWAQVTEFLEHHAIPGELTTTSANGVIIHSWNHEQRPSVIGIQSPSDGSKIGEVARAMDKVLKGKVPPIYFEADYPLMLDRLEQ
jgi:hypothetical protein